jgi:hypothetical protein
MVERPCCRKSSTWKTGGHTYIVEGISNCLTPERSALATVFLFGFSPPPPSPVNSQSRLTPKRFFAKKRTSAGGATTPLSNFDSWLWLTPSSLANSFWVTSKPRNSRLRLPKAFKSGLSRFVVRGSPLGLRVSYSVSHVHSASALTIRWSSLATESTLKSVNWLLVR